MIAESSGGGGSNGDSGGREALVRRRHAPAIRMRPVTPPRSTSGARRPLPAPRAPAIRATRRPVLQLVADSGEFDSQSASFRRAPVATDSTAGIVRFWEPRPLAFAFGFALAAVVVLVALATFAIRTGQGNQEASANAVSTTTVMSGVVPLNTAEIAIAPAPAPARAEIPVIDVKSLPAAPPAKRRR